MSERFKSIAALMHALRPGWVKVAEYQRWTVLVVLSDTHLWIIRRTLKSGWQDRIWDARRPWADALDPDFLRTKAMSILKRPEKPKEGEVRRVLTIDDEARSQWPILLAHLEDTCYSDGEPRTTSTVTIFVDQGMFKASLNDRECNRTLFISAETLAAVWDVLEGSLCVPCPSWREKREQVQEAPKSKKKGS